MQKYDIVIFGAGIAGLTVAHELSKYNLKIAIVEKEDIVGGMARTSRYTYNMPTEHSWRGYGPFYINTFQVMKEIKSNDTSVFNNLIKYTNFINFEDSINNDKNLSLYDNLIFLYAITYHFLSGNLRSEENKSISFTNFIESYISTNAKNRYIASIGPGIGLDPYSASIYHIGKYVEMQDFRSNIDTNWSIMNQPTSEGWFDPWYLQLKNKGVDFILSTQLTELIFTDNNAISAKLSDNSTIYANNYVLAINPYAVSDLYKNNKLGVDSELQKFINMTYGEPHVQISFRLGFSEKINIPKRDAFIFVNSKLNLTIYQQDNFWKSDIELGNNIKSLWSGTACVTYKNSELYNRRCDELTIDEFLNEVIHEISNSKEFEEYLIKNNNPKFTKLTIINKEVWYEWEYKNNRLQSRNKKWVNTTNNNNRPFFSTNYNNVFIAGAHCNTEVSLWSMESAIESGKRCAIKIVEKLKLKNTIELYENKRPLDTIYSIDDLFYKYNMPNLVDIIFVIGLFIIIASLFIIIKKMSNHYS
jgi:uncharacterized protein with NAD-binding domain and iron-sulfur cluster